MRAFWAGVVALFLLSAVPAVANIAEDLDALIKAERWEDVITSADKALADPTLSELDRQEVYMARASADLALAHFEEAIKDSDYLLQHADPKTPEGKILLVAGYELRGHAKLNLGRFDAAIADLKQAAALQPEEALPHLGLGEAYFALFRLDEAIAQFSEAIRLEPLAGEAYRRRGICYALLNRMDAAMADADKAISLDPYDPQNYILRARIWAERKQWQKSLDDFDMALTLHRDADTLAARAEVWLQMRQFDKALADYDEAVRLNPNSPLVHLGRGQTLLIQSRAAEAIAEFDKAEALARSKPFTAICRLFRALAEQALGRSDDALRDLETARDLSPTAEMKAQMQAAIDAFKAKMK